MSQSTKKFCTPVHIYVHRNHFYIVNIALTELIHQMRHLPSLRLYHLLELYTD